MDSTWGSLPSSNSMKMEEKLCAALLPIVLIVDALIHVCARCFDCHESTGRREPRYGFKDFVRLSQETQFTVNELEALNVLFKKLSRSIIDDDLIHKEELQLALFKSNFGENLFLDRVFDLFDQKRNGVIDFEEFVRSLNVFHPLTPLDVKLEFSFRLYDLRQTGFIEREEVKQMVAAILKESNLDVSDEMLQNITDRAFLDVDSDGDGKINRKDWKDFVTLHPSLLDHMTLPYLRNVTAAFPSFVFNTEVEDTEP